MHDDANDVKQALADTPSDAGAAEAYARLYDRHAAVVLSLCRRAMHRGLAEADDAMQETFIRAFRRLAQLDDPTRFRSWIYGIARHVCSEHRRAATRRGKHEGLAMNVATIAHPGTSNGTADVVDRNEQLDRLSKAIEQLDEQERLAVHLYYLQEDPAPTAMDAMNLSRSGFYKLLARARQRLADLMQAPIRKTLT